MKKLMIFMILFLFAFSLSSCDTQVNDDLAQENEVKVGELETELKLLQTQIEEYIIANDILVDDLEVQALLDAGYIDILELEVEDLKALLAGDGGTVYLDINGRLVALESLEDNDTIYDDQWIVDFVNSYNEYDDQWIVEFVNAYDEYDDQWIVEFINAYDEYDDQWIVDFINAYSEYDDQWIVDFVNAYSEYDDSEIQYFMGDFNLYYHIDPEVPDYYFYACPSSGTDTVTDYEGVVQTCTYNVFGLSNEKIEVFYDSGQLRYELRNTYNAQTTDIMTEKLTYYFENGDFYYNSTNDYDDWGGFFLNGGYSVYDFFGYPTHTLRGVELNLWDEFIIFLTTQ